MPGRQRSGELASARRPLVDAAICIADAHRDDGKRFVVHADDKLTAFLELERAIWSPSPFSLKLVLDMRHILRIKGVSNKISSSDSFTLIFGTAE